MFIFPKNVIKEFENIHYSPVHRTMKVVKECGRILFDSSDDKNGCPLNTDAVIDMVRGYHGKIKHPTVDKIVVIMLEFVEETDSRMDDVILFKADLSKAFTLLSFQPASVHLLTT